MGLKLKSSKKNVSEDISVTDDVTSTLRSQPFLPVFTEDTTPSFVLLPEEQTEIIISSCF